MGTGFNGSLLKKDKRQVLKRVAQMLMSSKGKEKFGDRKVLHPDLRECINAQMQETEMNREKIVIKPWDHQTS